MVGRITEENLSEADETFPGIAAMYWSMRDKPATFLQLLYLYENTRRDLDPGLRAES